MSLTLGLDASTKCIGWGVYNRDKHKLVDAGYVDISKIVKHGDKANHFIEAIDNKSWLVDLTHINIECAISGFGGGKTSQQILILLQRWNAVFCYILEQHYQIEPQLVDARTMRKQLFGKASLKNIPAKTFVKEQISKVVDLTPWTHYNKLGNEDTKMADLRDGVVAAYYSL